MFRNSRIGVRLTSFNKVRIQNAGTIAPGVKYETLAREWRLKWSADNDKKALADTQALLDKHKKSIASIKGLKNVQRIVCGGCHDYKIIVSLSSDKFGDWEKSGFAPEKEFLDAVKKIPGVSTVETQTYTIEPVL